MIKHYPTKMPVESSIIQTGGKFINWLNDAGVVYGSEGSTLYKTSDWLATSWVQVHTFASNIRQVREMPSGSLVVALLNGQMWKSDDIQGTWAQATFTDGVTPFQMESDTAHVQYGFGLDWYDNVMVAGEYGVNTKNCYLSTDQGSTWKKIFTSPDPGVSHLHDVAYDPYEGLVWVTTGDGATQKRVFWSADFGENWEQIPRDMPLRSTQIICLPERVLFGSDDYYGMYVWSHERPERGTQGTEVKPELVWSPAKKWHKGTPWMTRAAVTYGSKASAYFGFLQESGVEVPSIVWGTVDGKSYTPLWVEPKIPERISAPQVGILGCYGPDNENNLAVRLVSLYNGEEEQLLKIKLSAWEQRVTQ
jgi:hypothetical protein